MRVGPSRDVRAARREYVDFHPRLARLINPVPIRYARARQPDGEILRDSQQLCIYRLFNMFLYRGIPARPQP